MQHSEATNRLLFNIIIILLISANPVKMQPLKKDADMILNPNYDNSYEQEKTQMIDDGEVYHPDYSNNNNQNYEYQQDYSQFVKEGKTWRKVLEQQNNYVKPVVVVNNENENFAEDDPVDITPPTTQEPYETAITRLNCDNPWFWNSFKCLWLDVRERNYVDRTTLNAVTVGWILGPPVTCLLIMLCSFCVVTCYLKSRVKAFERRMDDIRTQYEPGSIKLDDGTVRKYTPNQEEIDAFENMISTLVSVV